MFAASVRCDKKESHTFAHHFRFTHSESKFSVLAFEDEYGLEHRRRRSGSCIEEGRPFE